MRKHWDDMTGKQRRWLKEYVLSGNAIEATFKTYQVSSYEAAYKIGRANEAKLDIQQLLNDTGVSDYKLTTIIKDGLNASYKIRDKKTNIVVDSDPDHRTRHQYLETALKLKGHLNDKEATTTIVADKMIVLNTVPTEAKD